MYVIIKMTFIQYVFSRLIRNSDPARVHREMWNIFRHQSLPMLFCDTGSFATAVTRDLLLRNVGDVATWRMIHKQRTSARKLRRAARNRTLFELHIVHVT